MTKLGLLGLVLGGLLGAVTPLWGQAEPEPQPEVSGRGRQMLAGSRNGVPGIAEE
jgi:hypothetical protein